MRADGEAAQCLCVDAATGFPGAFPRRSAAGDRLLSPPSLAESPHWQPMLWMERAQGARDWGQVPVLVLARLPAGIVACGQTLYEQCLRG